MGVGIEYWMHTRLCHAFHWNHPVDVLLSIYLQECSTLNVTLNLVAIEGGSDAVFGELRNLVGTNHGVVFRTEAKGTDLLYRCLAGGDLLIEHVE